MNDIDIHHKLHRVGLHDNYVEHGSMTDLRKAENIDLDSVIKIIHELLTE